MTSQINSIPNTGIAPKQAEIQNFQPLVNYFTFISNRIWRFNCKLNYKPHFYSSCTDRKRLWWVKRLSHTHTHFSVKEKKKNRREKKKKTGHTVSKQPREVESHHSVWGRKWESEWELLAACEWGVSGSLIKDVSKTLIKTEYPHKSGATCNLQVIRLEPLPRRGPLFLIARTLELWSARRLYCVFFFFFFSPKHYLLQNLKTRICSFTLIVA